MASRIIVVAMFYCMALAMLFLGGSTLYDNMQWSRTGRFAVMRLEHPPAKPYPVTSGTYMDVALEGDNETVPVKGKWLTADVATRLMQGEGVTVFYRPDNPLHTINSKKDLDSPWGWLIGGVICFVVASFAKALLKREAKA
jgi:hypothetical protein